MSESTSPVTTTTNANCCGSKCESKSAANVPTQPQVAAAAPAPATPKSSKRQGRRQH